MNGQERPTASCQSDVSSGGPSASAAPASLYSDAGRWEGGYRIEGCVCGGQITLYLGEKIVDVVGNHNETPLHLAWRVRQ